MNVLQLGFGSSWFWGLVALVVVLCGVGAVLFFRFVPVTRADVPAVTTRFAAGDTELAGGFYAVRRLEAVDLSALERQIAQTARSRRVSGSLDDLPLVFVHRSLVWGFPDVTQVWVEGDFVHIYSHLVYGGSDLGVNRDRMVGWFEALGI
ncbi:DUF1499 domain-containing protein [Roseibium alexandrii]|uniref:DUF1499 domain-containing protein n=1 Tax=Roseibium alexandrii (strain DSM 17067 / NCIMB 14079 / DFL-11) TaxID=244592 RepID=A0A5E8GUJ8_ROSAD|nr:DUF1499 domain-containing protein [Roseibium alexandrii]EEE42888.1 Uncharacterized protein SADFL11_174 [Roseibium alexandrii DFL-11]